MWYSALVSLTYGVRGIYWALLESCDIEDRTKGLALGLLSFLGYSPDFYQPLVSARLLEWFPGRLGYDMYYWGVSGMGVLGAIAAVALYRLSNHNLQPTQRIDTNEVIPRLTTARLNPL